MFLVRDKDRQEGYIPQAELQKTEYGEELVPAFWDRFATLEQQDGVLAATGSDLNHMLGILNHKVYRGVITKCLVHWQGYRASEPTWERVGAVNDMNSEILQDYAASNHLKLPDHLDLSISDYSDSDVFNPKTDDEEEAEPGTVVEQGASEEAEDEVLVHAQILEDMRGSHAADEGEDEDDEDDDEGLNEDELDDFNTLSLQLHGRNLI